ncbi:MBL fold metallo-hydrolase [Oscillochloris sp. ZM17-4]|uniref:MBL fold metallo-hydrolase n=1 Tax=Oscillochloris sp. ZM17-4 TaxID=2866714 RepID=UPI001C738989|nr:MBL fold metallo-hydrolase [Oscillochloris sp. ZM17-4]MBX0326306.1 MBL fold metallo-hydrolase [Oscillochloris sp. ZM17-4]
MKLNDDVAVLELAMGRPDQPFVLNLTLLLDPDHGPALVDTGVPGQVGAITAALSELGIGLADLRRIIITHQDYDHVGSLHDLAQASGASVMAYALEAPFISGERPPRFATPESLAARPDMRAAAEAFIPTPVDELLQDGARLDLAGGVRVVATPGHTPGHISLYLERTKTLITGDALRAEGGRLLGPNPQFTPDMAGAAQSALALAALDVTTIICYHGGLVSDDAAGQLRRVAAELTAGLQ